MAACRSQSRRVPPRALVLRRLEQGMHRHPRVEVVIPSFDRADLALGVLTALESQTYRDFRAVLVDDGSGDGTAEAVRRRFPAARVVALPRNRGFAGAVNAGLRTSPAELVALLNNDARPERTWLAELVRALDAHPDCDGAASLILREEPKGAIDSAGDGVSSLLLPYPIGSNEPDDGRYSCERPVFAASGGAVLYRRELFDAIGFFDERFFAYFEDVDFSFRAQLAGRRFLFVPSSRVLHAGGASSGGRFSPLAVRLSTRNLLFVLAKNLPSPLLWRALPRVALGQIYWFLKMAVKERRPGAWLSGEIAGVVRFLEMRSSGRRARAAARVSTAELARRLELSAGEVGVSVRRKRASRDGKAPLARGEREEARA